MLRPGSRVALALVPVLALSGCSDTPTSARRDPPAAEVTRIRPALDDALARVVPGLEDPATRAEMQRRLSDLSGHLDAGETAQARSEVSAAARSLASYRRSGDTRDAADVGAIQLALLHMADALGLRLPDEALP